jgi:glycosyltransferase involved in cell wall biosynthesis
MNVVIAALSAPAQLNGVYRHAANLARGLLCQREIANVHFLVGAWQRGMLPQAGAGSDSRFHTHCISLREGNLSRLAWYAFALPQIAAQLEADVLHLAYPAPLNPRVMRCPTIVTLHDLYPFDFPQNFGRAKGVISRALMRQCLSEASAIACVSSTTRSQLSSWFGPEIVRKSVTILNAVEPLSASSARPPRPLNEGAPFLLCVSQHRQNKNIPLAIQIFEKVRRDGVMSRDALLVVVGIPGPATSKIWRQIRKSKLEQNVVLLSGITDAELQWCYRHCGLLLALSSIEGFGFPIAEALLAGCPLVCSDIPAFREIGGDLVRYVPFGGNQLQDYESAIRETLLKPRSCAIPLPHLTPTVIGRNYLALYRRLIGSLAGSHPESIPQPEPKTKTTVAGKVQSVFQ